MKKFEEVEIVVRRLDDNKEARIILPSCDPYDDLEIEFDDENWANADYEIVDVEDTHNIFLDFKMYGNVSLDTMNDVAEKLTEIDNLDLILAINEAQGLNLEELLGIDVDDYYLYEDTTLEDYYYSRVEDGYYGEIPTNLMVCIDFEKFAKYESINENVYGTEYGVLVS